MRKTLVIGATSAIAQACAREFARDGDCFFLCARNADRLSAVAEDLQIRSGQVVHTRVLDVMHYEQHEKVLEESLDKLGGLDLVLIAHGTLPDQHACEQSSELTRNAFEVNALSVISLLTHLVEHFERSGAGTIVVITSVAGDRGRQSNYVYGAAKGALGIFCDGLRHRLAARGVNVLTVKPGFVDTPMTAAFTKSALWARPEFVGKAIYRAVRQGRRVLYVPWFWRPVMFVIRSLPAFVFNRLPL